MKRMMMKYLMINCKEASYLTGLKEEGRLSIPGSIKLFMHTAMCSLCKRFEKQALIIKAESENMVADSILNDLVKEKIQKKVIENLP